MLARIQSTLSSIVAKQRPDSAETTVTQIAAELDSDDNEYIDVADVDTPTSLRKTGSNALFECQEVIFNGFLQLCERKLIKSHCDPVFGQRASPILDADGALWLSLIVLRMNKPLENEPGVYSVDEHGEKTLSGAVRRTLAAVVYASSLFAAHLSIRDGIAISKHFSSVFDTFDAFYAYDPHGDTCDFSYWRPYTHFMNSTAVRIASIEQLHSLLLYSPVRYAHDCVDSAQDATELDKSVAVAASRYILFCVLFDDSRDHFAEFKRAGLDSLRVGYATGLLALLLVRASVRGDQTRLFEGETICDEDVDILHTLIQASTSPSAVRVVRRDCFRLSPKQFGVDSFAHEQRVRAAVHTQALAAVDRMLRKMTKH
jgi:hypothetical protein